MTTSIMKQNKNNSYKAKAYGVVSICFWLILWQVVCSILNNDILIVSPMKVLKALANMMETREFYYQFGTTMGRMLLGLLLGGVTGILMACFSYHVEFMYYIVKPFVNIVKTTPVASFIILALIWVGSTYLSVLIAFLMVFPVIYTNVLEGLKQVNQGLLDMAQVFRMPIHRKIRYIYIPSVYPYFLASCKVALGLSMKAGIAAEVIGIPKGSIGEQLYSAKLYLATEEVFAWTVVIIVSSIVLEACLLMVVKKLYGLLGGK